MARCPQPLTRSAAQHRIPIRPLRARVRPFDVCLCSALAAADAPIVRRLKEGDPRGMQLETEHLTLVLQSSEEILAWVDSLDAATRAEISPDWLARIRTS